MTILKESVYIFLAKFSFVLASLALSVMVAGKLGLQGFGLFTLVLSLYTMFELVVCFGFDNIIVREVASDHSKAGPIFSHGALIGIVSSALGTSLLVIFSQLMQYSPEIKRSIYLASGLLLPSFLYYLLENIFIALGRSRYIFLSALCRDAFLIIVGIVVLERGGGVNAVIGTMFLARTFGFICLLCFSNLQKIKLFSPIDLIFFDKTVRLIPTFLWICVSSCLFLEMDTVVLSKVLTISDLGLYNLAKRIFRVGNIFYYSFAMASFPEIAQGRLTDYKRFMVRMFWLCLSLIIFVYLFSGFFIHIFFGALYMPAMRYLQVLIWAVIPLGFSLLLSRFLIAAHRQNKDLVASFGGVVILVCLGIPFSLKWAGMGMAMAYTLSAFGMAGIFYYFTRKLLRE